MVFYFQTSQLIREVNNRTTSSNKPYIFVCAKFKTGQCLWSLAIWERSVKWAFAPSRGYHVGHILMKPTGPTFIVRYRSLIKAQKVACVWPCYITSICVPRSDLGKATWNVNSERQRARSAHKFWFWFWLDTGYSWLAANFPGGWVRAFT